MKLGLFPKMLLGILAPAMLGLLCLTGISSTLADHFLRQRGMPPSLRVSMRKCILPWIRNFAS